MKKILSLICLICVAQLTLAQTKFKEIYWKEAGFKFTVPEDFEITERDDEKLKMESEDFLLWVHVWDELDPMKKRLKDETVLKLTLPTKELNEPTYKGEIAGFFESIEGVEGEEVTVFNIMSNMESKISDKKVEFDFSVFEFNTEIERNIDIISASAEFVPDNSTAARSAKTALSTTAVAVDKIPAKKGFAAGLLKSAAKMGLDMIPGGGVAKSIFAKFLD